MMADVVAAQKLDLYIHVEERGKCDHVFEETLVLHKMCLRVVKLRHF